MTDANKTPAHAIPFILRLNSNNITKEVINIGDNISKLTY